MNTSLFLFQRDLRIHDNVSLHEALSNSKKVVPIFIYDPLQVSSKNKFKSDCAIRFMEESLNDLDNELKKNGSGLTYFHGSPKDVLSDILSRSQEQNGGIECVYMSRDYTPFSVLRMERIKRICKPFRVDVRWVEDMVLHPIGSVRTGSGKGGVYKKFTPYWNKVKSKPVSKPIPLKKKVISGLTKISSVLSMRNCKYIIDTTKKTGFYDDGVCPDRYITGGRKHAMKQLRMVPKNLSAYNNERNTLSIATSRLSAYLKFGCVSVREVYWVFQKIPGRLHSDLTKQLFWREFYYNLTHEFPHTLSGSGSGLKGNSRNFKSHYNGVPWITKKTASSTQLKQWNHWVNGTTGFPVVDACMRELRQTGYMHNRGRLITASFLVKHLFWSWEEGERYFAMSLIDYDPIVNNGNWQWVSGSGTDSQPYFRILNPWSQGKRFDPDVEYIHRWVPELSGVPNKDIHKWYDTHTHYESLVSYPKPIVNHGTRRDIALDKYKRGVKK